MDKSIIMFDTPDSCGECFCQKGYALDQALLQWKYEYLMKQEQWLVELMCGKIEEKQEEKQ